MARVANIDGDAQADLRNHGGEDKAVYAFAAEHYPFYRERFGPGPFEYGHFGENLTTRGMLEPAVHIGDRFRFGEAVFEVSQPRSPCLKFAIKMGSPEAVRVMLDSARTGFYLRVCEEGMIEPGPVARVFSNPSAPTVEQAHGLMYFDILNIAELRRAAATPALAQAWKGELETRLAKLV